MNRIQQYFAKRQQIIDSFSNGEMDKVSFLQQNMDLIKQMNIRPFKTIDTIEKGLYNYQYFNAYAKYSKSNCSKKNIGKEKSAYYESKTVEYYLHKDNSTLQVLKLLNCKNIDCYFIKTRSQDLSGKLVEIILSCYQYGIILHSSNYDVIKLLKSCGILSDEIRVSVIDSYINEKY